MVTLPLCSCSHTADEHMLFQGGRCLNRGCRCTSYDQMEAYRNALVLAETMSTIELLVSKLDIGRGEAIELIDQIDDSEVVDMLIDGAFDHMPSPAAAALHLSDARADLTVDRVIERIEP